MKKSQVSNRKSQIFLFNTLGRKKEVFKPLKPDFVRIYDCGPTVYMDAHIGNMWRYLVSDFLRRILEYNHYSVKQVMNITDVGHLTEDDLLAADSGEDKLEVTAKKEKKSVLEVADYYTKAYFKDRKALNILDPHVVCKATDNIPEMIKMIKVLEEKGYAYRLQDRICYDVAKFKPYGLLSGKKLSELKLGARLEPVAGKKNPYDFSLWIMDENHLMKWDSPWGVGYPGWHIECSAMSTKYLGDELDIHTGGEDNIFPHHENEIAQSEAATGKKFVRYWVHVRHNLVNGKKMSKSAGNYYLLSNLTGQGFDPMAYRYLCLTSHYRSKFNFSISALRAAQQALNRLRLKVFEMKKATDKRVITSETAFAKEFREAVNDDLGTPQAIAVVWKVVASPLLSLSSKLELIKDFDQVLGLNLADYEFRVPQKIREIMERREKCRLKRNFSGADKLREEARRLGYTISDTPKGPKITPITN